MGGTENDAHSTFMSDEHDFLNSKTSRTYANFQQNTRSILHKKRSEKWPSLNFDFLYSRF